MKKSVLKRYARLIAEVGGAVQKGQEVVIRAEPDQPEFVAMVAEECYKLGASRVTVDWGMQKLTKLAVKYEKQKTLSRLEDYQVARLRYRAEKLPVMIYLESEDPDGLAGINQAKFAKVRRAQSKITKPIRDTMDNRYQWCIAAVPGAAWATKLFPGMRTAAAIEKLWEAILAASRADGDDPVADWKRHDEDLAARCAYLNKLHIKELHYTASNGTDLRVGLMPNGKFAGGGEHTIQGVFYNPNMPTEECFTSPKRGEAEGIVYASKPLSYGGELIENFCVRFEKGRAVEVHAEKNEDLLREMISMDDGAACLGECALVPVDSPISESGMLFMNTLFDENAACHLALGRGFSECIVDYANYTLEELREAGLNDSMIHVDFMIGTPDLSIDALCEDGKTVPVFRRGTWAF